MDAKSLTTLELQKVLDRVAACAAFSASKELARALVPTDDLSEACRRQAETSEARGLLASHSDLSVGGAHDVRPQTLAATRGAVLDPPLLLDIKNTLVSARSLRRLFDRVGGAYPVLGELAAGLGPAHGLIEAISRVLDDHGEVLDTASEKLADIRRELRVAHERLNAKLQRLVMDPKTAPMLQEPIITQRDGRFVIPLRVEFKGRIKAVIHDQSSSGATLFIEPLQVVELNNAVRELELAERDEIRRILTELSADVAQNAEVLSHTVEALASLDLAFAKARYAEDLRAHGPALRPFARSTDKDHPGSTLRLVEARHPLLDPATVVPIDLVMDPDTYALVITGPNTGGKTVALKTAGLLALMAQCGLHLPCHPSSEVSVFNAIYADIGDEQSIEQSLSTFSSHISNIIRILDRVTEQSLVVLDELGAGTDPEEGSALARAILDTLLANRATTLVATHYPELKVYAHTTSGVRNASVEFDVETLRPTYRLSIGLPGRSNALAIAEKLGLSKTIIESARGLLSPESLRAESLLDEIHRQREETRQALMEARSARDEVQELKETLTGRLEGIESERQSVLEKAQEQVRSELEETRAELRALRRRMATVSEAQGPLREIQADLDAVEDTLSGPLGDAPLAHVVPTSLQPGDRVMIRGLDTPGVIANVDADQAEVQIGRLRVRARLEDLASEQGKVASPTGHIPAGTRAARAGREGSQGLPSSPPLEIDLRGRMVDEALEELERRLDAAYLAGSPFLRVIHGKGTGRLRQAIRQALKGNPYVASFESGAEAEGGQGVTMVRLAVA